MIEKVIFDSHNHCSEEEDACDEFMDAEKSINLINVNNNYNITIPTKDINGVKELISLNTSTMKKIPSRLSSLPSKSGSISLCKY
jgi:hypothetical protein